MKVLWLVRHAKSSWAQPDLDDFDRPLNKRGLAAAPELGRRIAAAGIEIDLIISSPAKRALATAKLVAEQIGYPESNIVTDERVYLASSGTLQEVVADAPKDASRLMLVGHNPGFTNFFNRLGDAHIDNLPTSAGGCFRFDSDDWAQLGGGELTEYEHPKRAELDL
jgi:phosphohistidine phosphatase